MKLSFTTLGCPEWDLETVVNKAVAFGFDAVDFRGLGGEMDLSSLKEFTTDKVLTKAILAAHGLPVSCFSSGVRLFTAEEEKKKQFREEIRFYVGLCRFFHSPFIRVFGGDMGDTSRADAVETAVEALREFASMAKTDDITILLETHDAWVESALVRQVIEKADQPNTGILWDVNHPYRTAGEDPRTSWETLSPYVKGTHWKDSRSAPGEKGGYKLTNYGEGDLPLREMITLCQKGGYSGYYTLEWEKVWHPDLQAAEEAFPAFVKYMRA